VPGEDEVSIEDSYSDDEEDLQLQVAIQESLDEHEARELREVLVLSKADLAQPTHSAPSSQLATSSRQTDMNLQNSLNNEDEEDEDSMYTPLHKVPSRLGTALTFANTTSKHPFWFSKQCSEAVMDLSNPSTFGTPVFNVSASSRRPAVSTSLNVSDSEVSLEEVEIIKRKSTLLVPTEVEIQVPNHSALVETGSEEEDEDMEPVAIEVELFSGLKGSTMEDDGESKPLNYQQEPSSVALGTSIQAAPEMFNPEQLVTLVPPKTSQLQPNESQFLDDSSLNVSHTLTMGNTPTASRDSTNDDDDLELINGSFGDQIIEEGAVADWDAAQEINVQEEEVEFARFASQIKGRDLAQVRNEIDEEIQALNQQRKAAMRDSEDVTQQMVSQIMVSAFCVF
jgi:DNA excision repair protein ERCC-5